MVLLLAGVVMGFTMLPDLSTMASFCVLLAKQQAAVLAKTHGVRILVLAQRHVTDVAKQSALCFKVNKPPPPAYLLLCRSSQSCHCPSGGGKALQCSIVQCSAVRCSAVKRSAVVLTPPQVLPEHHICKPYRTHGLSSWPTCSWHKA